MKMRAGAVRLAMTVVALALVGFLVWNWGVWRARAQVGAAYGARVACGCRHIEGRSIESCAADAAGGPSPSVSLTDSPEEKAVTASVPMLASRTARFKPGFGCLIDP